MKISVIRPIGAPSPSKEAESRRTVSTIIIPAQTYVGRCQKPISFHLRVLVLTVKVGDIPNR